MKIEILRAVIVTPTGQTPRPADPGEIVDVDKAQAALPSNSKAHGKPVELTALDPRTETADARPTARSRN